MRLRFFLTLAVLASPRLVLAQEPSEFTRKLQDPSPEVRAEAAASLAALGPKSRPATEALLEASKDRHYKVRAATALALGALGTPPADSVQARLVALLGDKSAEVQAASANSLAELGTTGEAITGLRALLGHKRWKVREASLRAIAVAGAAAEPLLSELDALVASDPSPSVRESAKAAAARVRSAIAPTDPAEERFLGATFRQGLLGLVVADLKGERGIEHGLRCGDRLAQIDHHEITSREDLERVLRRYAPGERIQIRVESLGGNHTSSLTLAGGDWPRLGAKSLTDEPSEDTPEAWIALLGKTSREADCVSIASRLAPHLEGVLPRLLSKAWDSASEDLTPNGRVVFRSLGADAVPALIAQFKDPQVKGRVQAAVALALIGPPAKSAIPQLLKLAQQEDRWGERALVPLAQVCGPTPEVMVLVGKLRTAKRVDPYALVELRGILGREALGDEIFGALLQHERSSVRLGAARGLGRAARKGSSNFANLTPTLLAALKAEKNAEVRDEMIWALAISTGSEHASAALPVLLAAFDSPAFAAVVIDSLAAIGEPAIQPLAAALAGPDSTRDLRFGAARALVKIARAQPGALAPLLSLLGTEDERLHEQIGEGLSQRQGPLAESGLRALFKLANPASTWTAIRGLAKNPVLGARFESEIVASLGSKNPEVQAAAADAVGGLGFRAGLAGLRKLWDAKPEKVYVLWAVLRALVALGPSPEDLERYVLSLEGKAFAQGLRGLWSLGAPVEAAPALCALVGGSNTTWAEYAERVLLRVGPPASKALEAAVAGAKKASDPRLPALEAVLAKLTSKPGAGGD